MAFNILHFYFIKLHFVCMSKVLQHNLFFYLYMHALCCTNLCVLSIFLKAPRAKMNQQRSRRFRASKEGVELAEEKKRMREEIFQHGMGPGFLLL